jgi:formate/nitrite transporter
VLTVWEVSGAMRAVMTVLDRIYRVPAQRSWKQRYAVSTGLSGLVIVLLLTAGLVFVAYFLAVKTGVVTAEAPLQRLTEIATLKGATETEWQIFLRAMGCNWLVCLAVWMAMGAEDVSGKVLAIFFPIMGFVAMGFDHVVANMFFLPAAIFAGVDGVTWGDTLHNWVFAFIGNLVGAAVFVAGSYWYLYGRVDDAGEGTPGDTPRDGDGRVATATDRATARS